MTEDEEIGLNDGFQFVRIDETADFSGVEIDEDELGSALEVVENNGARKARKKADIDIEASQTFSSTLDLHYPKDKDDDEEAWSKGWKVEGELVYTLKAFAKLYYDIRFGRDYYEFTTSLEHTIDFSLTVTGTIEVNKRAVCIPLAKDIPVGVFFLNVRIYPVVSFEASVDLFRCKIKETNLTLVTDSAGFSKENYVEKWFDKPDLGDVKIEIKLGIGVEASFGYEFGPKDNRGMSTLHATVDFDVEAYLRLDLKVAPIGTLFDQLHDCIFCLEGTATVCIEGSISLRLKLVLKVLSLEWEAIDCTAEFPLGDCFISFSKHGFAIGLGQCPHIYHKINVIVESSNGNPVAGATVSTTTGICDANNDGSIKETSMQTNARGIAVFYFPNGEHQIVAEKSGVGTECMRFSTYGAEKDVTITLLEAYDSGKDGPISWTIDDDGTLFISGQGGMKNYYSSGGPWCAYSDEIKKVVVEEGVSSIGNCAFLRCEGFCEAELPDSLTSIGGYAFYHCTSLQSIVIPDQVTSVGDFCFNNCSSLKTAVFGKSVTSVGTNALEDCTSLVSVTLGESMGFIPEFFCSGCNSLKSVVIPDNVSLIEYDAFLLCDSLKSVTVGDGVTRIDESAFQECTSLSNLYLGTKILSIGASAFYDCKSLAKLTIPNSVTSIGVSAFEECSGLKSVHFGSGLIDLGGGAFSGCSVLRSASLPSGLKTIGDGAFSACSALRSVSLPSGLISIGYYAFVGCECLYSVHVPTSVKSIGKHAFYNQATYVYYAGSENYFNNHVTTGENWVYDRNHLIFSGGSNTSPAPAAKPRKIAKANGTKTVRKAYTVPGTEYLLLVVKRTDLDDLLERGNVLYIDQKTATDDSIRFQYIPLETVASSTATIYGLDARDLPHVHKYNSAVTTDPTCTEPGVTTYTCTCGDSFTEPIEALGHIDNNEDNLCDRCKKPMPTDHTPGDINGDGVVNNKDLNRLMKKLAGENVDCMESALDVNGDGTVNNKDLNRLMKHLAGEHVDIF